MSATVCPVNPPGHDWENGLSCRWCWDTRTVSEAILSQLSSRRGGDPASAQSLLDAYQAEVLAEDGQAYPGELAMLHGLIATLTAVAEHGDLKDVRELLEEHKADDTAARTETPAVPAAPDFFQPGHTYTHVDDGTDWKFRVDTVTTHPEDGERTALGWRHFRGTWEPYAYGEDDYEIHLLVGTVDAGEGGATR